MNVPLLVLALLLPLLVGAALLLAIGGRPARAGGWAAVLGGGWVLGALLAGLATQLVAVPPLRAFAATLPWLGAVLLASALVAWWRLRTAAPRDDATVSTSATDAWWWLMLALVVLHLLLALLQALALPTIPWDAWTTWMGRARGWTGSENFASFVSPEQWAAAGDPQLRATLAPHYPQALSRMVAWFASAAGGWHPPAVHAPWPMLGAALATALHGHLRRAGAAPRLAMAGTFACVSLPLLNAHMTLAGYADLWVAAVLLLAAMHWLHWLRAGAGADLLLALVFAAMLPLLKLEGAVWLACLAAAWAWMLLRGRWRVLLPLAGVALLGVVLLLGTLPLPVPGLGLVRLSWEAIEIPAIGVLELYWRPVASEVLATLFALPNWHLLWIALPVSLLLRWRRVRADRPLQGVALLLLLAFAFLFVLFFFTDASAWAENLTSVNRLLLHVAPLAVAFTILLWRPPEPAPAEPL